MNDTTRGEVRERVDAKLEKYADDYAAWQDGGLEDTGLDDSRQIAAEIIALVTAARDAEIREEATRPETIEAVAKANYEDQWQGMLTWDEEQGSPDVPKWIEEAESWIRLVLAHIGLHGDGTGGQE